MNIFDKLKRSVNDLCCSLSNELAGVNQRPPSKGSIPGLKPSYAPNNHICICLDVSGSMGASDFPPNRLEVVKQACSDFLDCICADDPSTLITIIGFGTYAHIAFPAGEALRYQKQIRNAINNLRIAGGTDLCNPLRSSLNELQKQGSQNKRIILLTDGCHFGLGSPITDSKTVKSKGIQLDIIGIGKGDTCNHRDLERMASVIDGVTRYWFITDTEGLFARFQNLAVSNKRK